MIECSRGKVKRTSTTSKRKPWTKVEAGQYWRDTNGIKNTWDLVETKKRHRRSVCTSERKTVTSELNNGQSSVYSYSTFLFIPALCLHHTTFLSLPALVFISSLSSSLRASGRFHTRPLSCRFTRRIPLHSSFFLIPFNPHWLESVVCALSYGLLRVLLRTHGPQALHCQLTLGAGKPCAVHVSVWLLPLGYGLDGSATSFSWICGGTGSEDSQSIPPAREHISGAQNCMCDSQRTCKGTAFCV